MESPSARDLGRRGGRVATVCFVAGFGVRSIIGNDGGQAGPQGVVATQTPLQTSTSAPTRSPTGTATLAPTPVPTAPFVQNTPAPPPTQTPDFTAQPAIEVVSVSPTLGTHIETASVDIAIDVRYQAGRDSNVVSWSILYCASLNDCNTYGGPSSVDIEPGSSGRLMLGAPFAAGGNCLRPIVICQYTVEIAHFLTPEARWQSQLANDPRCHPEVSGPRIKVLGVTPDLGTILKQGDVISVNVEYDAGPATSIQVRYLVAQCTGDIFAVGSLDVKQGTSGVVTILVPVTRAATGELHHIDAQLLNGDLPIASYSFGPC
jgi:hypothetical protein